MSRITDLEKPFELSRSRLLMQQKLNNRSKEAMTQREITPEILPTKKDVKLLGLDDDIPEAIANKHRKAMSIQIKLDNMANNSIIDELGWKPSKIKSETTQQMIDEYKAEMNQQVKSIDPTTGNEVYYFKPSSVDLTPVQAEKVNVLTDADKRNIQYEIVRKLGDLRKVNKYLSTTVPVENRKLDTQYNRDKAAYDAWTDPFDETADPLIQYELDKEALRQSAEHADNDRKQLILEIDNLKIQIDGNDKAIHQNAINQAEADKQTRLKIAEAEKEIRSLNIGSSLVGQQAGEDDETYRQRLLNIGQEIRDDNEVEQEAGVFQSVRAKYNLKDFLSDQGKIETIIKKLSNDEKTLFNTKIASIKKNYLDTYGFNNRNMTPDKIVDFIKDQITGTPAPAVVAPPPVVVAPSTPPPTVAVSPPLTTSKTKGKTTAFGDIQTYAVSAGLNPKGKSLKDVVAMIENDGREVPRDMIDRLRDSEIQSLINERLIRYYVKTLQINT